MNKDGLVKNLCFVLLLTSSLLTGSIAIAGKELPFPESQIEYLEGRFFDGKLVNPGKVQKQSDLISGYQDDLRNDFYRIYRNKWEEKEGVLLSEISEEMRAKADSNFWNKANERKEVWTFDYLLGVLMKLKALAPKANEKLSAAGIHERYIKAMWLAQEAELLFGATQHKGNPSELIQTITSIKQATRTHYARKNVPADQQASNLWDPETETYLDLDDIVAAEDLSKYNPGPDSKLWQDPGDISNIDVKEYIGNNEAPMFAGIDVKFPTTNGATFDGVRMTQSHPKLDLKYKDADGKKQKAKIKFGPETHAQVTVHALASLLGFHADPIKTVKKFRIDMDDSTEEEMRRDWAQFFLTKKVGMTKWYSVDTFGEFVDGDRTYLAKEGALTARPKEIVRVGGWQFDDHGHDSYREVRAMQMFNIWVNNSDAKGFANNKLALKKTPQSDGTTKIETFQFQHDLGHSFGHLIISKLNAYPWKMIKNNKKDYVTFKYGTFKVSHAEEAITYADAKWFARLVAQLTPKQIQDAVDLGGWSPDANKMVFAKLMSRRNDMVINFDLEGEVVHGKTIEVYEGIDTNFSVPGTNIVDGKMVYCEDPEYTVDHCHYTRDLLTPYGARTKRMFGRLGARVVEKIDRFELDGDYLGLDPDYVPFVIYEMGRKLRRNPAPQSDDDIWLVTDTYKLGFRLSTDIWPDADINPSPVSADAIYWRSFTLTYPTTTMDQALFSRSFFVDLIMPLRVALGNLPKKYVLVTQDHVSLRGRVRANPTPVGPNADLADYLTYLDRSVIRRTSENEVVIYDDNSMRNKLAFRIYLGLAFIKIPFVRLENEWGKINGKGYLINTNYEEDVKNAVSEKIMKAVNEGDFSDLKELAVAGKTDTVTEFDVTSKFMAPSAMFSLFGLFRGESDRRTERLHIEAINHKDKSSWERDELQVRARERYREAIINDEVFDANIYAFARLANDASGEERAREPVIKLRVFAEDLMTDSVELDEGHVPFINSLGDPAESVPLISQKFAPFDRPDSGGWGPSEMLVEEYFYSDAVEKILALNTDPTPFWDALDGQLSKFVEGVSLGDVSSYRAGGGISLPKEARKAVSNASSMLRYFRNAQKGMSGAKQKKRKWTLKSTSQGEYQVNELVKGLKAALYLGKHSYKGHVLAALNQYIGYDKIFIRTRLGKGFAFENTFPGGKDLVSSAGVQQSFDHLFYMLSDENDPIEMWNAFGWLSQEQDYFVEDF